MSKHQRANGTKSCFNAQCQGDKAMARQLIATSSRFLGKVILLISRSNYDLAILLPWQLHCNFVVAT